MYSSVLVVDLFHYYKTGIEGKHIGGFPIIGQFIACTNPEVIEQHDAKFMVKSHLAHHQ